MWRFLIPVAHALVIQAVVSAVIYLAGKLHDRHMEKHDARHS